MEQPKKRGRPPKSAPVVNQVKSEINQTRDAVIEISLWMPGHEVLKETVTIRNILGSLLSAQKKPENYMEIIKRKLK